MICMNIDLHHDGNQTPRLHTKKQLSVFCPFCQTIWALDKQTVFFLFYKKRFRHHVVVVVSVPPTSPVLFFVGCQVHIVLPLLQ